LADAGRGVSRTVAIVQARMTSTRLPGKVLADLCGEPLLARMLGRIRRARRLDAIVVATTDRATDDPVVRLAAALGVGSFRGDEADVLSRFAGAAAAAAADIVVRLTADCPLHDPALVDEAVEGFEAGGWDYYGNAVERTYPDGLDVEVFSRAALDQAAVQARHPFLREHVTPWLNGAWPEYGAGAFRRGTMRFAADFAHLRWTVDTPADLDRVRSLWTRAPRDFTWLQALAVATREPALLGLG
jgi:spore coat polysaccharide biosynthesis protein SpsF (cytidylyltransferase family)